MLANLHYALLLASTVFSGCVYAGSWAWQPKVNTSFGSIEITEPLSGTVNGIAADKKLHELSKRYGYPSRLSESRPWPGCTIRYCFVDDNTERVLFLDLKAAIEKWYTSGLSRETFKWEKVDRAKCFRERSNHLVITITQVPSHSTTLGYKPASPRFPGPSMNLYNGELTALDRIAGFAHEVGHAWGLHHEHQLPKYWFSKDGFENANGGDSAVFGIGTFHCQRLADYAERAAHVRDDHKQPETTVQKLCTHYSTAELYSFSAVNWLPEISALMITDAEEGVDWASIMVYKRRTSIPREILKSKGWKHAY